MEINCADCKYSITIFPIGDGMRIVCKISGETWEIKTCPYRKGGKSSDDIEPFEMELIEKKEKPRK